MTSTKPYLIRALYEWILDNHCTPHLMAEADGDDVHVPRQYVENGVITLNISPNAVRGLELGNERVTFSARFSGSPFDVSVPVEAVQAIYARENGQGIFLSDPAARKAEARGGAAAPEDEAPAEPGARPSAGSRGAPHLTIVK